MALDGSVIFAAGHTDKDGNSITLPREPTLETTNVAAIDPETLDGDGQETGGATGVAGAFPISRSRAHTHRRHGHPLQTVPSAGLIERPQEKNRVDALR